MSDIARCRAEQARALANYRETGCRGALLGVNDWMAEEVVIMSETTKTAGQVLYEAYEGVGEIDPIDHQALAGEGPEYPPYSIGNRAAQAAAAVIAWHEAAQWRPMVEAPRDGEFVLIQYKAGHYSVLHWDGECWWTKGGDRYANESQCLRWRSLEGKL